MGLGSYLNSIVFGYCLYSMVFGSYLNSTVFTGLGIWVFWKFYYFWAANFAAAFALSFAMRFDLDLVFIVFSLIKGFDTTGVYTTYFTLNFYFSLSEMDANLVGNYFGASGALNPSASGFAFIFLSSLLVSILAAEAASFSF